MRTLSFLSSRMAQEELLVSSQSIRMEFIFLNALRSWRRTQLSQTLPHVHKSLYGGDRDPALPYGEIRRGGSLEKKEAQPLSPGARTTK